MTMALDWLDEIEATSLGRRPLSARPSTPATSSSDLMVEHFQFEFRRWDGPKLLWSQDFGKGSGQVYSLDGTDPIRSCNEVEVAKQLRRVCQHALWYSGYQHRLVPEIWQPWVCHLSTRAPDWLTALDLKIRERIASMKGGMPDVVAWDDAGGTSTAIFVECKGPREPFSPAQEEWLPAAVAEGISLDQVAVSLRPF